MQQILWAEIAIKGTTGVVLIVVPLITLTLAGIEKPNSGLWPRLTGALILSIAVSVWIGLTYPEARGSIGPAALVPINLISAAILIAALVMGAAAPTRRGKLIVAAGAVVLLALGFLEIAHA
ncbi:ABC transporter permease [Hyphomicrobium sp. B1]|uniref:ABC transporter permease n=1 Tax=Hyphomicrobium sp. B1 TaxID=3075651 RepID=UPI003C2E41F6